jgi:drug/metabolite transporter (DMT)-like permease
MEPSPPKQGRYYVYALITVLLWSTSASAVKTLTAGLSSLCVLGYSSLAAALVLLLLLVLRRQTGLLKRYGPREYATLAALGFLGMFLYSALYYTGIDRLTSQEACILNYLWPVMIVLFSCLILKEPLTWRKGLAIGLSFSGVLVIALFDLIAGGGALTGDYPGMGACVLAAVCYGLFCVLNKKRGLDQTVGQIVFWGTTCLCAFALCAVRGELVLPAPAQWKGIAWLGVMVDGLPYLMWAVALNGAEDTARIANLAYLTPILSVLFSAVTLGESLSPAYLIALGLILAGILVQILGKDHRRA